MRDFLPKEAERMRHVEETARELARLYLYEEIITPVVESYDLLEAKAGEEIRHRMYAFKDLGGRKVALRPEFTPSIARLVTTKMKSRPKPMRIFCAGSLYRYDEPQYGRYREFWQSNYELIGSSRPEADAEILMLTNEFLEKLGLRNYWFKIGHMGILRGILSQEGVREEQQSQIMHLLDKKQSKDALGILENTKVSTRCMETLEEVIDTRGRDAFPALDRVEKTVKGYSDAIAAVENLREIIRLTKMGDTRFEMSIEAGFARGLEYYTGIIFEPYIPEMDIALGGGGRYDKLVELFGGEPTPAVGVAHGIDRLALATKKQKARPRIAAERRVLIVPIGEEAKARAVQLSLSLRKAGMPVGVEVMGRTVSRALQDADRRKITHAVILGPEELEEEKAVLRDMKGRKQKVVNIESLSGEILKGTD
jgi:histidyl-tRNA synthetase